MIGSFLFYFLGGYFLYASLFAAVGSAVDSETDTQQFVFPILIPLIVSAIRRSLELAETMESRAWGATKKRTNLYVLKMKSADYIMIAVSIGLLILGIYIRLSISIPSLTMLLT